MVELAHRPVRRHGVSRSADPLTKAKRAWNPSQGSIRCKLSSSRGGKVRLAANQQSVLAFQDGALASIARKTRSRAGTGAQRTTMRAADRQLLHALQNPLDVIFLDIETTGLSRYYDEITVVGWLHDACYHVYVTGDDPTHLQASLRQARVIVTYNGTLFDLPFLRRSFADIQLPPIHADLRYIGRRVGLTGGQKAIERELGVAVRDGMQDVDGAEAVLLWHRYLRGSTDALRRLIDYNHCDVLGLRHLLDAMLSRLVVEPDLWCEEARFVGRPVALTGWAQRSVELPCASRLKRLKNSFDGLFAGTPAESATIIGIDLTGSEARPSGWSQLIGSSCETAMVGTDQEIVDRVVAAHPCLVSIDSPLSLPYGRTRVTDDDPARATHGIMRQCERELKRRGINVYPCLLPSMQRLTARGIRLATLFRKRGIPVIESYPGAAQDIMGIPRKGAGTAFLRQGLTDFGVHGAFTTEAVTHDELDAITSALVGSFFLAGKFEALSGPEEDPLIIPKVTADAGPLDSTWVNL